jgi:hypothetical protein
MQEIKWPLELWINFKLADEFRWLVKADKDCKIINELEVIRDECLIFIIECPDEKKESLIEYAFMTHIKNPDFQKYYKESDAYKEIAEEYKMNINQQK